MLGSDEQIEQIIPRMKALNIIGCYAQTELGHGSDVSSLETTASLDKSTDEWVLHTPTIRATKFWPGSMGIMANWAVVYARCIVGTKDLGVKPFLC
jgi:acyl-CoA oxidase